MTMTDTLDELGYLTFAEADLEVRARGDGRTVNGIVAPWDRPTQIGSRDYEMFQRNAFARSISERGDRITLHYGHPEQRADGDMRLIGRFTEWRDDTRGQWGEARIDAVPLGDIAVEQLRSGSLRFFSVGFRRIGTRTKVEHRNDGSRLHVRSEAPLRHVALVADPAYDDAVVDAIRREHSERMTLADAKRRMAALGIHL